jgi:hypothetical protein
LPKSLHTFGFSSAGGLLFEPARQKGQHKIHSEFLQFKMNVAFIAAIVYIESWRRDAENGEAG